MHHLLHASHLRSILQNPYCIFLNTMLENKRCRQTKINCWKLILQSHAKDFILSILSPIHPTSPLLPYAQSSVSQNTLAQSGTAPWKCRNSQGQLWEREKVLGRGMSEAERLPGYKFWNKLSTRTVHVFSFNVPSLNTCGHLQSTGRNWAAAEGNGMEAPHRLKKTQRADSIRWSYRSALAYAYGIHGHKIALLLA